MKNLETYDDSVPRGKSLRDIPGTTELERRYFGDDGSKWTAPQEPRGDMRQAILDAYKNQQESRKYTYGSRIYRRYAGPIECAFLLRMLGHR